jgi:hypothetical protein
MGFVTLLSTHPEIRTIEAASCCLPRSCTVSFVYDPTVTLKNIDLFEEADNISRITVHLSASLAHERWPYNNRSSKRGAARSVRTNLMPLHRRS